MNKLTRYYTKNFGVKKLCEKFLQMKRGYNLNLALTNIQGKSVGEVEKRIVRKILQKKESQNRVEMIDKLKEIQSYRGMRHIKSLPTRGQRTKTNSRTTKRTKKVLSKLVRKKKKK